MTDWDKEDLPDGRALYRSLGPNGEHLGIADWVSGKRARFNAYVFTADGNTQVLSGWVDTFDRAVGVIKQFLEGDNS